MYWFFGAEQLAVTLTTYTSPRAVWLGIPIAVPFVLLSRIGWFRVLSSVVRTTRGKTSRDVEALECHDDFIVVPSLHLRW